MVGFVFGHSTLQDEGRRVVMTDVVRIRMLAQRQVHAEK